MVRLRAVQMAHQALLPAQIRKYLLKQRYVIAEKNGQMNFQLKKNTRFMSIQQKKFAIVREKKFMRI